MLLAGRRGARGAPQRLRSPDRGIDFGRIVLESGVNVQDSCVIHGFPKYATLVEENGHIGHGAVSHSCTVRRNALVGMNAVVMDEAEIGE